MKLDFHIRVTRYKRNKDFCFNDKNKGPYGNRLKNNFKDIITIERYNQKDIRLESLYACPCQAWANHPMAPADGSWSLNTGTFRVEFFVEKRGFVSNVHGIGGGYDKCGNYIDPETFDIGGSNRRMLIHDDRSPKGGRDNGAFSQGCIELPAPYKDVFDSFLIEYGVKPGDYTNLSIQEI